MANIKISKNEEKFIKAMNNATNSVVSKGNITLTENEEKLLKVIKNNPYLVGNLITENSELIKNIYRINQHFASIAQKIIEANRVFLENISKIDFGAINRRLQEVLDDFFQFVESIEEEKRGDYYVLLKKYGKYLKEIWLFVSEDFKDFWGFWLPYNFKYLGLEYNNYNNENDKYKLEANDFELYHEYENLIIIYRKSSKEALEIVWNEYDKRNTGKVNILPPPAENTNIKTVEKKKVRSNVVKKTTKDKYELKLYAICDLVEKGWRKETDRTIEQLEKIYKKAKGEYAKSNQIDRSQLHLISKY